MHIVCDVATLQMLRRFLYAYWFEVEWRFDFQMLIFGSFVSRDIFCRSTNFDGLIDLGENSLYNHTISISPLEKINKWKKSGEQFDTIEFHSVFAFLRLLNQCESHMFHAICVFCNCWTATVPVIILLQSYFHRSCQFISISLCLYLSTTHTLRIFFLLLLLRRSCLEI